MTRKPYWSASFIRRETVSSVQGDFLLETSTYMWKEMTLTGKELDMCVNMKSDKTTIFNYSNQH